MPLRFEQIDLSEEIRHRLIYVMDIHGFVKFRDSKTGDFYYQGHDTGRATWHKEVKEQISEIK